MSKPLTVSNEEEENHLILTIIKYLWSTNLQLSLNMKKMELKQAVQNWNVYIAVTVYTHAETPQVGKNKHLTATTSTCKQFK